MTALNNNITTYVSGKWLDEIKRFYVYVSSEDLRDCYEVYRSLRMWKHKSFLSVYENVLRYVIQVVWV